MANLSRVRTDAPISRRIVTAFLDFLDSVEPAPGVDLEGLEVAKDCLAEVFQLRQLSESERPEPNLLVNILSSQERSTEAEAKVSQNEESHGRPSAHDYANVGPPEGSKVQVDDRVRESCDTGVSKDELFGQYFDALEKIRFFRTTPNGEDDHVLLDRATCVFHDAIDEMERSGCKTFDRKGLADALKTLGNKAMQSKLYSDAIERYSCAIALCERNAVYYCNRAAAYTQMHQYNEAVKDCLKSIEIDPNYSKAYSRLGLAYYAQGNYSEALNKGFRKALELDPNNDAVKENIRVAEQKLKDEQERRHQSQGSTNQFSGGPGSQAAPPPFVSMSFDSGPLPVNFESMFSNIAGNGSQSQRQNGQSRPAEDNSRTHSSFTSRSFDSTTMPPDLASMFMNMAGNAYSQTGSSEQNNGNGAAHSFPSMPFDATTLPSNLAGMFTNMAGHGSQGQTSHGQPQGGSNVDGFDDPGIGINGNISFNLGDHMPEDLTTTLRSVMGMFSGGAQGNPQGNGDGRSAPR